MHSHECLVLSTGGGETEIAAGNQALELRRCGGRLPRPQRPLPAPLDRYDDLRAVLEADLGHAVHTRVWVHLTRVWPEGMVAVRRDTVRYLPLLRQKYEVSLQDLGQVAPTSRPRWTCRPMPARRPSQPCSWRVSSAGPALPLGPRVSPPGAARPGRVREDPRVGGRPG